MSYANLIEDMVSSQRDVLGDGAVDIAQDVSGLEMDDSGAVAGLNGDGVKVAAELVSGYVDNLGGAATVTLQSVADDYADELELPASLQ